MSKHFLGRDVNGNRYYAEIRLNEIRENLCNGVGGETILEFAASGFVIEKGRREAYLAGQMIDELIDVTNPATGWSGFDIANLVGIWREYHLNGMNAECEHMSIKTGATYDDNKNIICPISDYKYGSSWITKRIPNNIIVEIERLMSLPSGKVPLSY